MNLPDKYTLTIYTVSGEFVWSQNETHEDVPQAGMTFWDLRTINNQEVAPGLYLYTLETQVESSSGERNSICTFIGKFAIVR